MNKASQLLERAHATLRSLGHWAKTRKARTRQSCLVEARESAFTRLRLATFAGFCFKNRNSGEFLTASLLIDRRLSTRDGIERFLQLADDT